MPSDTGFTVVRGDIVAQQADALANAAGTSLQMGSGVAGALQWAAAGPIHEAAVAKGPVELGEVAVTDAFDFDADYVIHAAAIPYYDDAPGDRGDTGRRPADAAGTSLRTYRLSCRWAATGPAPFRPPRCFCARLM